MFSFRIGLLLGGSCRNLNVKKKIGCGTTRIDRKAIEIYVEILIHIERLHSIESHYMNETRLLWRKHVNKSTQF